MVAGTGYAAGGRAGDVGRPERRGRGRVAREPGDRDPRGRPAAAGGQPGRARASRSSGPSTWTPTASSASRPTPPCGSYQQAKGLDVDGIVGLATWGVAVPRPDARRASGAAIGGSNIPAAAQATVEQTVQQAGSAGWPLRAMPGSPGTVGGARAPAAGATDDRDHRTTGTGTTGDHTGADTRHPALRPSSGMRLGHDHPARKRVRDVAVRAARRPEPRRNGHRRRRRHARARRRVRNREPGRPAERLREHRLHHAHEPVLDLLRAPVALRRRERRTCSRAR